LERSGITLIFLATIAFAVGLWLKDMRGVYLFIGLGIVGEIMCIYYFEKHEYDRKRLEYILTFIILL